jgi:hypothetical protein
MIKKKKYTHFLVCELCLKEKHEKECYWVHKPDYRYVMCKECVEIKKPLQYDLVVEIKEKVHLQCKECKSKKTINIKEAYIESDFFCKKCNTENNMIFI